MHVLLLFLIAQLAKCDIKRCYFQSHTYICKLEDLYDSSYYATINYNDFLGQGCSEFCRSQVRHLVINFDSNIRSMAEKVFRQFFKLFTFEFQGSYSFYISNKAFGTPRIDRGENVES